MFLLIDIRGTYSVQQKAMKTRFIPLYLFALRPVTEWRLSKSNKKFFREINDRRDMARS